MVYTSDKKLFPWTKHTSYANIVGERRPSELGQSTMVTIKNEDNDLDERRNSLSKLQKKSLFRLDAQRKQLEKSMLEYSDKVRDILDSRTNNLFREIHTRQSHHLESKSRSRSLTNSIDSQESAHNLPVDSAHIRKRRKRLQISRKCIFPPISESLSRNESRHSKLRILSDDRNPTGTKHRGVVNSPLSETAPSECVQLENDNGKLHVLQSCIPNNTRMNLPEISVYLDNAELKSDISCTHDPLDSGYCSTADLSENTDQTDSFIQEPCQKQNEDVLLTLPKIHKRNSKEIAKRHFDSSCVKIV